MALTIKEIHVNTTITRGSGDRNLSDEDIESLREIVRKVVREEMENEIDRYDERRRR